MGGLVSAFRIDFGKPLNRYLLVQELVRVLPGEVGMWIRERAMSRYFKHVGEGLRMYPGTRLFGVENLSVGANCWIGFDNMIQANGGVKIGDNVLLGPGVKIWSVSHVFADPYQPIHEQGYRNAPVVIGSNVWIGANAFIMPGAVIGDGVVISAGSVVGAKAVEPYAIVAGNPARKIGSRLQSAGMPGEAGAQISAVR
jgi:acetyltransferase-like isoleucine patch superfamily enzyme